MSESIDIYRQTINLIYNDQLGKLRKKTHVTFSNMFDPMLVTKKVSADKRIRRFTDREPSDRRSLALQKNIVWIELVLTNISEHAKMDRSKIIHSIFLGFWKVQATYVNQLKNRKTYSRSVNSQKSDH